ncbi:MAG TPA: hypothetical protein VI685_05455 [Candidatus Angelobacter sp.]
MKKLQFKTGLIFASWALLLVFGCHKKKPPIPPQEQPPTITTAQQPPQPEPTPQNPPPQNPPPPQEEPQANNKPPEKPAPKHPKTHPVKKPATEPDKTPVEIAKNAQPEPPTPPRVVIQEGGANAQTGQTGTGAPGDDNQATTQQLLDSTDSNIRNLKRTLTANEQSMLAQIKDYVAQSKQAAKDGDLVRAHNLALKAHLLSDELAKSK